MIDSPVWADLGDDDDLLDDFGRLYDRNGLDAVFSIGNFLDLARGDDRDELSRVIDEFADEYLGPLQLDLEGEYRYASSPSILATIDAEWYESCKQATKGLDDRETLRTLFREANFDGGPTLGRVSRFVEEYSNIDAMDLDGRMDIPEDTSPEVALKKIRTFPEYTKPGDGTMVLEDENVPTKRYVLGMSMIYVSETRHEPQAEDYRDAMIWSQGIIAGCDVLWSDQQWAYDHPIVSQIVERLDRGELEIATDVDEFESALH